MKKNRTKAEDIIKKYGQIDIIREEKEFDAMIYKCKLDKVISDSTLNALDTLNFMIAIREEGTSFMFLFNISSKSSYGEEAYNLLNEINEKIVYGKFTIDSEEKIMWSVAFEAETLTEEEFKSYLQSCIVGVIDLVVKSRREDNVWGKKQW